MTKAYYSIIFSIFLNCIPAIAQKVKHKGVLFEYTQADSIVNAQQQILAKDSFFIAYKVTHLGYIKYNDKKRELYYENPFQVSLYFKEKRNYYAKKINNYGLSKSFKTNALDLDSFLAINFEQMLTEKLERSKDTLVLEDGRTVISSSITDHVPYHQVWINYKGKQLIYYFSDDFETNKWNLTKKQYLFLKMLQG
ncbi:MAG: hypothetical protein CFE21_07045 [Bacteroidetes bacterium B1(2017)]|nr:MAG: hypothetical protein CFE21_07045 [Bacteroidetes bacterium B1(2017)]